MITFPHTRTRRISVQLDEMTLGQGTDLCDLPPERHELNTTALLRYIAARADKPRPTFVTDPLLWTVEERTMVVCTYLAAVSADGPDFSVGKSKLTDYIDFARDSTIDETDLGVVANHPRVMRPLLGLHAQALEMVCTSRGDWVVGAMACQMFVKDSPEAALDFADMHELVLQEWITKRMATIRSLAESDAEELYAAFDAGAARLAHFFDTDFDKEGVIYLPTEKEGAEQRHAPARFPADHCASSFARSLSSRPR